MADIYLKHPGTGVVIAYDERRLAILLAGLEKDGWQEVDRAEYEAWLEARIDEAVIDFASRDEAVQTLGDLMSAISRECWCAGWMENTEIDLPALCRGVIETGRPQVWGLSPVLPGLARVLAGIAGVLGHWVKPNSRAFEGDGEPAYVPYRPEEEKV
jgi:hypothetical protein